MTRLCAAGDVDNIRVGLKYEHLVTGLVPDKQYRFFIRAVNIVGGGPKSSLSDVVRALSARCTSWLWAICR